MNTASDEYVVTVMSALNKAIKENDGSITRFHLYIVSRKIMETQIAKKRVEEILQKLREGINTVIDNDDESEVNINEFMSVKFKKSGSVMLCTVRECSYRKWCTRILPMVINDEKLMILPCTILMECCLQNSEGGVRKIELGESSCEIEIALRH